MAFRYYGFGETVVPSPPPKSPSLVVVLGNHNLRSVWTELDFTVLVDTVRRAGEAPHGSPVCVGCGGCLGVWHPPNSHTTLTSLANWASGGPCGVSPSLPVWCGRGACLPLDHARWGRANNPGSRLRSLTPVGDRLVFASLF